MSLLCGPIFQHYRFTLSKPAVFDDVKLEALIFSWAAEAKLFSDNYILLNPTPMTELEDTCTNHCVTKPPHSTPMVMI
jgi:hypothetical protein